MNLPDALHDTAARVEDYLQRFLFDPRGIPYAGIDSHTGKPFDADYLKPIKVPRRAQFDPVSWWTYEDSAMALGFLLDARLLEHQITGNLAALQHAHQHWYTIRKIYAASQVMGAGSFLRPYGGFDGMLRFAEPLGTDQAGPLFMGMHRYLDYADAATQPEVRRIMLDTLRWYEQQNFSYFYYRFMIHEWQPPLDHGAAYYLPAIAWAARHDDDKRWQQHLDDRLAQMRHRPLSKVMNWGGELALLRSLLGDRFESWCPAGRLDPFADECSNALAAFNEPGTSQRLHPQSAEPGFVPVVQDDPEPGTGMGYAYYLTVHQGRRRPTQEAGRLCALACQWNRTDLWGVAVASLACRQRVPQDFTAFMSEDHDALPETVQHYARSVGIIMMRWLRDYWMLRATDTP